MTTMTMAILHKITWQEFERIQGILDDYKEMNPKGSSRIDNIIAILSNVKKQAYNILVDDLEKVDFHTIAVIMDMWNVLGIHDAPECDGISTKLQKAYFKEFNEQVFVD